MAGAPGVELAAIVDPDRAVLRSADATPAYAVLEEALAPDSPFVHDPAVAAILALDDGMPVVYEGDWATHEPESSWNGAWEIVGEPVDVAALLAAKGAKLQGRVREVVSKRRLEHGQTGNALHGTVGRPDAGSARQ